MYQQNLDSFLEKCKRLISSNNAGSIFKKISYRLTISDMKIFYDFLGEVLLEKPVLQKGKKQAKLLKGYDEFIYETFLITGKISIVEIFKLEKYFVEKYCILENEEISISFFGTIKFKKTYFQSRIFITNFRIIVLSSSYKPSGGSVFIPWAGLIFNMFMAVEAGIRKTIESSITKSLNGSVSTNKVIFGFQFPISHLTSIVWSTWGKKKKKEKGRKSIKFTSTIETKSDDLEIVQGDGGEEILNKLVELLNKNQEQ